MKVSHSPGVHNALGQIGLPALPPPRPRPAIYWLKALFGTPLNALISLALLWLLWFVFRLAADWLFFHAVISGGPEACKTAHGACWPFIAAKLRFIIFGVYPYEEHWRVFAVLVIIFVACGISMIPRFWTRALLVLWAAVAAMLIVLIRGGVFGLAYVPSTQWSGLPLSIILSFVGFALGLPLGIALALARISPLPAISYIGTAIIEFARGVPLITILFMASVMSPLFMPKSLTVDKLLSVQVALIIFIAAYVAETVRGGLLSIPQGQLEAARSLGLGYWKMMRLVALPQAIARVLPALVTLFIAFFQDTTLVTIVGMLDFLSTVRAAMHDPNWQGIAVVEGYVLAGLVYLLISAVLGLYGRFLERIDMAKRRQQPSQPTAASARTT
jgi:general L-amino acid transport system permease protein